MSTGRDCKLPGNSCMPSVIYAYRTHRDRLWKL